MALLLTFVPNTDLEQLLVKVPQIKYAVYLQAKGWERREAVNADKSPLWYYQHLQRDDSDLVLPAPFCFDQDYADVGRRCWELVRGLAAFEQRSPVAVLCEIDPRVCDWLDDHADGMPFSK